MAYASFLHVMAQQGHFAFKHFSFTENRRKYAPYLIDGISKDTT